MNWIPILKPRYNAFIINIPDLTPKIRQEIEWSNTPKILGYHLTQTVGRIFENLWVLSYEYSKKSEGEFWTLNTISTSAKIEDLTGVSFGPNSFDDGNGNANGNNGRS